MLINTPKVYARITECHCECRKVREFDTCMRFLRIYYWLAAVIGTSKCNVYLCAYHFWMFGGSLSSVWGSGHVGYGFCIHCLNFILFLLSTFSSSIYYLSMFCLWVYVFCAGIRVLCADLSMSIIQHSTVAARNKDNQTFSKGAC